MEYLSFVTFLSKAKRNFKSWRYESDIHYRSVLFHQFGESYRYHCRMHQLMNDYDTVAYDVRMYEQRLEAFHSR